MRPAPGASLDSARRGLAAAARALADYRRLSGAASEAGDAAAPRDFAGAEARGALDEARARALEMVNEAKAGLPDGLSARQRHALELVATGVVARYA